MEVVKWLFAAMGFGTDARDAEWRRIIQEHIDNGPWIISVYDVWKPGMFRRGFPPSEVMTRFDSLLAEVLAQNNMATTFEQLTYPPTIFFGPVDTHLPERESATTTTL